jgi:hypothetical protein
MNNYDFNRVEFYSKEDMAGGYQLSKGENILRNETKRNIVDINDILELYHIKKYLDNELYLKTWTESDIIEFKQKVIEYGKIIGQFMSTINDSNVIDYFEHLSHGYINSFWELVNNHKIYKKIARENLEKILTKNPHEISNILSHQNLVNHYNSILKKFLMIYPQSAEILLSIYEAKKDLNNQSKKYLPQSLTIIDKENIVSNYIDSDDTNLNYISLIKNARNQDKFKLSDKIRLKAKRKEKKDTEEIFSKKNTAIQKYGVSISYPKNPSKIKDGTIENSDINYSYSLAYIKKNNDLYNLFINFKLLFEYLDSQNRIEFTSKKIQMGIMEQVMGIKSQNDYPRSVTFNLNEMTSQAQIISYSSIINGFGKSIENVLHQIFTSIFPEKYNFVNNARLTMPSQSISSFEKVRIIAPEFESVLKQFKLFVENGEIDFELLQMTSTPSGFKNIPSLIENKYIYLKEENNDMVVCSNLFFSDQTTLTYVKPFKEKKYTNFFNLLVNEEVVFENYKEHQKQRINYLIEKGFLLIDKNNFIQIQNIPKVCILKDLYENEVGSFYHYPKGFQEQALQMKNQNMVYFESSLFSKPEQSYFNYYLNKSEFTNGLDLRNSYLHGTQANPDEVDKHEYAYFTYLKLLILVLLKIEDELMISKMIKNE